MFGTKVDRVVGCALGLAVFLKMSAEPLGGIAKKRGVSHALLCSPKGTDNGRHRLFRRHQPQLEA